jgi:carbon-monoxide dehydrogenase medium subunit
MKRGVLAPRLVVSLGRIDGLAALSPADGGGFALGARATMREIAASAALQQGWTALAEGAGSVGGPLIRNRATVGGNIVNARPCADSVPPLVALGARARLVGPTGERTVELDGFITGPGETIIGPAEVLSAVELPAPGERAGSCYIKITRRAAMEVTLVGCAAALELGPDGRISRARLVFTSVAPVPLRVAESEPLLVGQRPTAAALDAAAEAARKVAVPIDDHRAPALFRSEMVRVTARRALQQALQRAGGEVA